MKKFLLLSATTALTAIAVSNPAFAQVGGVTANQDALISFATTIQDRVPWEELALTLSVIFGGFLVYKFGFMGWRLVSQVLSSALAGARK